MNIAYKLWGENDRGLPGSWVKESFETNEIEIDGYFVCSLGEYNAYLEANRPAYDEYVNNIEADNLKVKIRVSIDKHTDELMNIGFVYQNKKFRLNSAARMDYKADYDLNNFYIYPHKIKGVGETFLTFNSRKAHTAFVQAAFTAATTITQLGWAEKTKIMGMSLQELQQYEDTR